MKLRNLFGAIAVAMALSGPDLAQAERFSFAALGDTAYNLPGDVPVYEALIRRINAAKPEFTVHVGDTWGGLACTEENHRWVLGFFQQYAQPLIYTPGDNEWTDCRRAELLDAYARVQSGKGSPADQTLLQSFRSFDAAFASANFGDPLRSLATIRRVFFARPQSLGGGALPVVRQADVSSHKAMVENLKWERGGVVFATVNVAGSGNGFTLNDGARAAEAIARNNANIDWLKAAFADAKARGAKAVVIAMHASLFVDGRGRTFSNRQLRGDEEGPFYWTAYALRDQAAAFGKPVLLIHGDFHDLIIDRPFLLSQGEAKPPLYANITRLQVYGAPELKAVRITVDTDTPWVFGFEPLY